MKKDFPIFKTNPNLVYLDCASTSQTPQVVLDAMNAYYAESRANVHRGIYELSQKATEQYEAARTMTANFIGAQAEEIVFTSGTTHGLNMLAHSLGKNLKAGDNVVLTRMEHHANLVPWLEMSKRYGFKIRYIELENYDLQLKGLEKIIDKHTKIVSFALVSNTLGTINLVWEIIELAKKMGAVTIIDAAQSVPHMPIDASRIGCDFLVFSGHKMYGPTGIGVLFGKKEQLEIMEPFTYGGEMIREVTYESAAWHDTPWKFEAGTPNIAGAIGLAAAIRYLQDIGPLHIIEYEVELMLYAMQKLQKIRGLKIIGPTDEKRVGVISFTMDGIHPHDIASILDTKYHIAVRAGHHCTMPLMQYLGIRGTVRMSLGIYNTKKDVDLLVQGLKEVQKIFS